MLPQQSSQAVSASIVPRAFVLANPSTIDGTKTNDKTAHYHKTGRIEASPVYT